MPFPDINEKASRKDDHSKTYIIATIIGVGLFFSIWAFFKLLGLSFRLIKDYWMYVLGIIIGLVILKKLFSKKRVIMEKDR